MFTKKQNNQAPEEIPIIREADSISKAEEQVTTSTSIHSEEKSNTVVSRDVMFEGNITSNELVHIYGKVIGNITGKDNTVKVMLKGQVIGNIICKELIINGRVEGECTSDSISIENNGEVHGTIHYSSLSIKKGGILSGQAKVKNTATHTDNAFQLKNKVKQEEPIINPCNTEEKK